MLRVLIGIVLVIYVFGKAFGLLIEEIRHALRFRKGRHHDTE